MKIYSICMAYVFPNLFLKGIEIYGRLFTSKESPKITWKLEQKSVYVWLTFFQTYQCFFKGIEIHGKLCTSKESPRYFWYVLSLENFSGFPNH